MRSGALLIAIILMVTVCCGSPESSTETPSGLRALPVISGNHPRAFFFRSAEMPAKNPEVSYKQWEKSFERLMGIEGKVLDEEIPGLSSRNVEFFNRFKRAHPDQLVLLHYNGNARDPRNATPEFFAGHWVYYVGATVLSDVPAEPGETEIKVADASLYRVNVGRADDKNEDIGICTLDKEGRPNWFESEQVELTAVDEVRNVIRVKRGRFGTQPRAFLAGKAYAAAHVHEGPWGSGSNLMWFYNYSTTAPKDALGRPVMDVLAEDVARHFRPDGDLSLFDGIEFDVLTHLRGKRRDDPRDLDFDADGKPDTAVVDGVNTYGAGVIDFLRQLRQRMGPDKLIMADGWNPGHQRAFGILNGVEFEGFPGVVDYQIKDWTGSLNRMLFWSANAYAPAFNYVNHKFAFEAKVGMDQPDIPDTADRLVLAVATIHDAAICYSRQPAREGGELAGIWDELRKGVENEIGWLGKAVDPPVRLADIQPDLLEGGGERFGPQFLAKMRNEATDLAVENAILKVSAAKPGETRLWFRLTGVPAEGPDLLVKLTAKAEISSILEPEMARQLWVSANSTLPERFQLWVNSKEFTSRIYFRNVAAGPVDLTFELEGGEPLWISSLTVHAHPEAMYREYERGLVLVNPALHPYTFDLATLLPGTSFRRLKGSAWQSPGVNDGSPVSGLLTLQAKDGLFLVKGE